MKYLYRYNIEFFENNNCDSKGCDIHNQEFSIAHYPHNIMYTLWMTSIVNITTDTMANVVYYHVLVSSAMIERIIPKIHAYKNATLKYKSYNLAFLRFNFITANNR